ncbi:hypothetical protein C8_393 [Cannes 8 virus]|uniref:hypothetical protein n=1 Tax=Melbournevirus TaxID=1560514 RepID=UPI000392C8FE|nr:hypothetical protein MEL_334 [Melbournevirus]AGV01742.1 hypothetical protein C8_393 [Cannes 8 virus]AIT54947.1 hypothetical protein MEL_334 [Melbournevirus]
MCEASPLSLSLLCAFVVAEEKICWNDGEIDGLSEERISFAEENLQNAVLNIKRGRPELYIKKYEETVETLHERYEVFNLINARKSETLAESFENSFPFPETVGRFSKEIREKIFEILLFWKQLGLDRVTDQFLVALCKK